MQGLSQEGAAPLYLCREIYTALKIQAVFRIRLRCLIDVSVI